MASDGTVHLDSFNLAHSLSHQHHKAFNIIWIMTLNWHWNLNINQIIKLNNKFFIHIINSKPKPNKVNQLSKLNFIKLHSHSPFVVHTIAASTIMSTLILNYIEARRYSHCIC